MLKQKNFFKLLLCVLALTFSATKLHTSSGGEEHDLEQSQPTINTNDNKGGAQGSANAKLGGFLTVCVVLFIAYELGYLPDWSAIKDQFGWSSIQPNEEQTAEVPPNSDVGGVQKDNNVQEIQETATEEENTNDTSPSSSNDWSSTFYILGFILVAVIALVAFLYYKNREQHNEGQNMANDARSKAL